MIAGMPLSDTLECGSSDTTISIYNLGNETLRVDSVRVVGVDSGAFIAGGAFPAYVAPPTWDSAGNTTPGDTLKIPVRFAPPHAGAFTATARIYSSDTLDEPMILQLNGYKDSVGIAPSASAVDFGGVPVCYNPVSDTITLTNTGNVPAAIALGVKGAPAFFHYGLWRFTLDTGANAKIWAGFAHPSDSAYTGALVIYTQCDSLVIPLAGRGIAPRLAAENADMGAVCAGERTAGYVTLANAGDTAATVTAASIAKPFTVDSPSAPFIVPANDSIRVRVRFAPTADGNYAQPLALLAEPCDVSDTVTLTGSAGTPALIMDSVNYGGACAGDTLVRTLTLRDSGGVAATVDTILVSNAFVVLTPLPVTIGAGDSAFVQIAFVPAAAVAYASNVYAHAQPCGVVAQSGLAGVGVDASVAAAGVDCGTIILGNTKDTVIVIRNTGAMPATVQLQVVPPGAPFIIDSSSVAIGAGDSATVGVHYQPTQAGADTAWIVMTVTTPCAGAAVALLTGAAVPPDTTRLPAAEICLSLAPSIVTATKPITATIELESGVSAPVDSLVFDLRYNPGDLWLTGITSARCRIAWYKSATGVAHITLATCGAPLAAGQLCEADFMPLISTADTTRTQMIVENAAFYPLSDSIQTSGCAVPLTILPFCGMHGVIYTGSTTLSQNYPNPFSGETRIHVTLSPRDAAGATLRVYNMLGEEVADLTNHLQTNGDVALSARTLQQGVYYYVLRTGSGRWTREMFVVK